MHREFAFSVRHMVYYSADDIGPLDDEGWDEHVDAYSTIPVTLEKRHQKPETNKYHHVNILEHWKENEFFQRW